MASKPSFTSPMSFRPGTLLTAISNRWRSSSEYSANKTEYIAQLITAAGVARLRTTFPKVNVQLPTAFGRVELFRHARRTQVAAPEDGRTPPRPGRWQCQDALINTLKGGQCSFSLNLLSTYYGSANMIKLASVGLQDIGLGKHNLKDPRLDQTH